MQVSLLKFSTKLLVILTIAFVVHLLILNHLEFPLFGDKIVLAYVVNVVLAIVIVAILLKFKDRLKQQLGFLFIAGSLLKFVAFFLLFYVSYKADGSISKLEFAAFFVPYLLCLIIETSTLAKWLNNID